MREDDRGWGPLTNNLTYSTLHLFCGSGGAALGLQSSRQEWRGLCGDYITLAGIDNDPEACVDFKKLTKAPAVQMDLFSTADYKTFHGQDPPADWREVMPTDIRAACGGVAPDVIFSSPPCKGFSGLLPKAAARSKKYQALNNLTLRGIWLALEAFKDDLPGVFLLENVPRITTRGKALLSTIKGLLQSYGYAVQDGFHDCGEIGGLGQRRRRYLLIARNPEKIPAFIYQPPKKDLKTIGDIIGTMPLPDDPAAGAMHRLPRLQWKTWVRLALIPAGGDWRDLEKIDPGEYGIDYRPRGGGPYGVQRWDEPASTVTGHAGVRGSNAASVADPRTGFKSNTHVAIYGVCKWDEPGRTITSANGPSNGAPCIADPRLNCRPRAGSYGVQEWDEPANTVTGADIHAGSAAISDPRLPADTDRPDPPPVIIALDGAWHRPLTTLELAALQGFPLTVDGEPLELSGRSQARWRERIGNAVPVQAAAAIGDVILGALLRASEGWWLCDQGMNAEVWVERKSKGAAK